MARAVRWLAALPVLLSAAPAQAGETLFVRRVHVVGDYVEAHLTGRRDLAFLAPASEACARVLRPEGRVEWIDRGFPGRIEADGVACETAGIVGLETWRDRRPRPDVAVAPRATARYRVVHRDGRAALLRGRFPLAPLVGMPGAHDLVALVADDARCAGVLDGETASLEYRASGRTAFRLVSGDGPCPVRGFARPVAGAADAAASPPRGGFAPGAKLVD